MQKNSLAHSFFFKDKASNSVDKEYFAIAMGKIPHNSLLALPLGRSPEFFLRRVVNDQGKSSMTLLRVEKKYQEATALSVRLYTGRTHQIRAHLSSINHPIFGDNLYGGDHQLINRQALHCQKLVFNHPFNQELVTIDSPIPDDLNKLLNNFRTV